jgi:molybdopterin-guanine dinucleotide biosynthesis protein A
MSNKHQKHSKLKRPNIGFFGRNEFALVGAPCSVISEVCKQIIKHLDKNLNICYIDADHGTEESESDPNITYFQDKIRYKRLDKKRVSEIDQKFLLSDQDMIFVNGNHFQAEKQIVFIHSKKEASLLKRLNELTEIKAFILCDEEIEIFDSIKSSLPDIKNIPVFKINESESLANYILSQTKKIPLNALILSGGKSTRMGEDKSLISYHGVSQQDYLFRIFKGLEINCFVSCRPDQATNISKPSVPDSFIGLGPYGGILSAFQYDPDAAWLVIACDLPLISQKEIMYLISERNHRKMATACYNPETEFPDPLFTIWEPKSYQTLLSYLSIGYSCPRKVLINSDIALIHLNDPSVLKNANTPEDREEIKHQLKNL